MASRIHEQRSRRSTPLRSPNGNAPTRDLGAGYWLALQRSAGNQAVVGLIKRAEHDGRSVPVQRRLGPARPPASAVVRHDPSQDEVDWKVRSQGKTGLYTLEHAEGAVKGGVKAGDLSWGPHGDPDQATSRQEYLDSFTANNGPFDYNRIFVSPGFDKNDFRYWVYYMLEQTKDAALKRTFLERIFEPNESRTLKAAMATNQAKKDVLHEIFAIGYVSYENLAKEQQKQLVRPGAELANPVPGEASFGYGFRGDDRKPGELAKQGGFTTKTDATDPTFRTSMALDQPWNPFSTPASLPGQNPTNNAGYFRRGDTDNDLTTIISVTPNFVDATKFPFIDEYPKGSVVVNINGGERRRSTTYVYLVLVEEGFDTKAAQGSNAFPEIATRSVPTHNVVAAYEIERTHFGSKNPKANDGHTAKLLSCHVLDGARTKYAGTPSWAKITRAIETYATLDHFDFLPGTTPVAPSRIQLAVNFASKPGQDLFVSGGIPELGNWDIHQLVPMSWSDANTWVLDKGLPVNNSIKNGKKFEYKFLVREDGNLRWEADPNHDYDPSVKTGAVKPERWH